MEKDTLGDQMLRELEGWVLQRRKELGIIPISKGKREFPSGTMFLSCSLFCNPKGEGLWKPLSRNINSILITSVYCDMCHDQREKGEII